MLKVARQQEKQLFRLQPQTGQVGNVGQFEKQTSLSICKITIATKQKHPYAKFETC